MEQEEQKVTLYDFLYIDHERVRSLYAQLFSGLLGAMENVASETKTKTTSAKIGGAPIVGLTYQQGRQELDSRLEKIDPHDLILRDVLQGLNEEGLIQTELENVSPGKIILIHGSVSLLDFNAYKHFIDMLPHFVQLGAQESSGAARKKQKQQGRAQRKDAESTVGIIKGLAEMVPWSIQMIFKADALTAWGAIRTENLRDTPGSMTLKCGPTLAGKWYMLGIVDIVESEESEDFSHLPDSITGIISAAQGIRSAFGRPDNLIGVTPLLIFRKLLR